MAMILKNIPHILVVDDDKRILELVKKLFK